MGEASIQGDVARAGERSLWAAVILAAIQDATARPPAHLLRGDDGKNHSGAERFTEVWRDREDAISFLTGSGLWRSSREAICDAAGMDPTAVLERVSRLVEAARREHGPTWDLARKFARRNGRLL